MTGRLRLENFDFNTRPSARTDDGESLVWRERIGEEVPQSRYVWRGLRPTLIAIEGNLCLLRYPNGATMRDVPIQDLMNQGGGWKDVV